MFVIDRGAVIGAHYREAPVYSCGENFLSCACLLRTLVYIISLSSLVLLQT